MPSKETKTLESNEYLKSDKAQFIVYANLECIIKEIDGCKSNPKNSFTTKMGEHIPSAFSLPTMSSFKTMEKSMMYIDITIS